MAPYDSAATRTRLLDAAYAEFVERGLAGARVDRIAAAAAANKQAIYAYFGSKDALFDAVLAGRLRVLADLVPFRADDLPGYSGALFDRFADDPGLLRLVQWKTLERPEASEQELAAHLDKAGELAGAHGTTLEAAMDTLMIALAAAQAWHNTSPEIRNPAGDDEATRRARHRAAVVAAVDAATTALLRATT
ncbi:TetR family transcriptional regulator [Asanoa sp. NPDC050611]|uniref:TetR/AcrR family transcriptional regulator n=1 Tax=Asanoa sp. NPDC050611 TaxID=3157098 RepID=UPI0033FA0149